MKKLILTAAAVLTSVNLFAAGTVTFSNFLPPPEVGGVVSNAEAGGALVSIADNVTCVLLYAPLGGSVFDLVEGSQTDVGIPDVGLIYNLSPVALQLPNVAGGASAQFKVQAWDKAYNSYADAYTKGLTGESAIWEQPTGGGGTPAGAPIDTSPYMPAFSVQIVPEPSVFALGLLGAGALLLLRRRK